ncbi:energy transducer TonB [Cellulophaga sp. E16_2]|uniref:energy transducer TonB n=1 Tax=Cellulophaga sp. E16_2 TaxID=2789297 RepID=UPI002107608C|nr:energy transducer TonB [Cellulophaga sp. E16_2]
MKTNFLRIAIVLISCNALSQTTNYNPFLENNFATFKDCNTTTSNAAEECFRKILITNFEASFDYQEEKTETNTNGRSVYFSFKVDSIGEIHKVDFYDSDDEIIREPLDGSIAQLPKMIAPTEDNIKGNTTFILELKITPEEKTLFKIIDIKTRFEKPKTKKNENSEVIEFNIIDKVPVFPGCEIESEQQRKQCFQGKMMKHIMKNFRYPEFAQEKGIQGRVNVIFMIDKEGNITAIKTRGSHPVLELEARRIIAKLPQMEPGEEDGKPVKVPFSLPITFRLQ